MAELPAWEQCQPVRGRELERRGTAFLFGTVEIVSLMCGPDGVLAGNAKSVVVSDVVSVILLIATHLFNVKASQLFL